MDIPYIKKEILMQLPISFRQILSNADFKTLQEVRFRCKQPLMLQTDKGDFMLDKNGKPVLEKEKAYIVSYEDIKTLIAAFCENSVYAYQREICDGFLTIRGGHRVGLAGRCVMSDGKITNITDISGLNLRIAKEFKDCAKTIYQHINFGGRILNTILISPPGCGKTTMLRDLARLISHNKKVTIVDERSEIAAVKNGAAQFDVGTRTDILDRFPKSLGMLSGIRSLSPEVIITDEIGAEEDFFAIKSILNAGCKIITSMHGYDSENLFEKRKEILELFECAVIMSKKDGIPAVSEVKTL